MKKAFRSVRGAIRRRDAVELKCKKIWLERVVADLSGTVFASEATVGLAEVNRVLAELGSHS